MARKPRERELTIKAGPYDPEVRAAQEAVHRPLLRTRTGHAPYKRGFERGLLQGRDEERAAIVAWLRREADRARTQVDRHKTLVLATVIEQREYMLDADERASEET